MEPAQGQAGRQILQKEAEPKKGKSSGTQGLLSLILS